MILRIIGIHTGHEARYDLNKMFDDALICSDCPLNNRTFSPRMPPKSRGSDTPSPTKKRKTETTPVKRGVDFFFKKQVEKNALPKSQSANGDTTSTLFVKSDGEDEEEWEMKRRRQEEEDEKFARELQEMEKQREIDDEEFARRLARDYEAPDNENEAKDGGKSLVEEEDLYGDPLPPQQS